MSYFLWNINVQKGYTIASNFEICIIGNKIIILPNKGHFKSALKIDAEK